MNDLKWALPTVSQTFSTVCRNLLGLCLWGFGIHAQATPQLRCDVTYAGQTHVLKTRPVSDPYSVEPVDIGGRFFFKMVMVATGSQLEYIKLYAYLNQEPRPLIVQHAKYLPPFRATAQPYLLTGQQHVYADPIERELIYKCWLGGVQR